MPALSGQSVAKIAATRLATLQAISKLPQDLQKQLNTKLGEILRAPVQNETQRAAMLKQATDNFIAKNSTQIKAIESATSRATNSMLRIISNPNLTQAEKNQQLATYGQKEMMKLENKLAPSFLGATNQGATSVALSTGIPVPSAIEKSIRRQQEKLSKEAIYQQKQQQVVFAQPSATPDNKEPKTRNMGRGLGAGAMAGSMALMMGGSAVGGTAGNVMATGGQSLMMGGMAASMLPASMMAGPIGPAIIGLAVALPLVIKGIKTLQESAERFGKSMINAMTTSTLEAETFGIKINDIGNFSFPKITKEAQASANAVDSIVQKIKQLDGADPLAQMVESMKKLSDSEVMSVIKQKYLTLRVQGVDAKAAQDFVTATLRAAGKEMAVGSAFDAFAGTVQNKSTSEMIKDLYSNAKFISNIPAAGLKQTDLAKGLADKANKDKASQLAQTLFDVGSNLNNQGKASEFAKIIHDITLNLKEGSAEAEGFKLTVEELYNKMGFNDAYNSFKKNNISASDSIMLIQLKAMGLNVDLDKLSKEPWRIKVLLQYGQEVMAAQDVATAQQALFDNAKLKTLPTDNSFQETPDQKAAKKAINAQVKAQELVVKAQELVVSNLEKEQKLRNNIADAQKRELDYAKSKADIQGQIQEALASGNVGKAVSLQNDLNAATANYNKELQTASDQRKIDIEKDKVDVQKNKLDAIKSKLDLLTSDVAARSTTVGKSAMKSYEAVQKEILEGISKTIKVSSADIEKWTKTLNPYVQGSADLVKGLVLTYEQSVPKKLSDSIVSSMSNIIDANNRGALSAAIFNEIQSGKNDSTALAVKAAIDALMPNLKAQITNKARTVTVLSPTPVPGNQGRKSIDIQDIIQTYNYLTPDQESKLRNGNASGGHISGPGTGTSDSIPAYLSNGEYVIRASAVKQYGKGLFDNLNTQKFVGGGYATTNPFAPKTKYDSHANDWLKSLWENPNMKGTNGLGPAMRNEIPFGPGSLGRAFSGAKDLERILTNPSGNYEKALDKILKYQKNAKQDYDLTPVLNRLLPEELFGARDTISTYRGTSTNLSSLRPGDLYNRIRRTSTSTNKERAEVFGTSMFGSPILRFDLDKGSRGIDFKSFIPHDLNDYRNEAEVLLHPEQYIVKALNVSPLGQVLGDRVDRSVIEIVFERLKSGAARVAQVKGIKANAGNNSDYEKLIDVVNDNFHNGMRGVPKTQSYSSSVDKLVKEYADGKITRLQMNLESEKLKNNLVIPKRANGGYMSMPKYHSGGKVGYKYGGEVMAMLQGGEVVIPKEIVKHYENGGPVSNSNSSQYNINVSVNGSNASADEIAKTVMRTIQNQQNMISGPRYV